MEDFDEHSSAISSEWTYIVDDLQKSLNAILKLLEQQVTDSQNRLYIEIETFIENQQQTFNLIVRGIQFEITALLDQLDKQFRDNLHAQTQLMDLELRQFSFTS